MKGEQTVEQTTLSELRISVEELSNQALITQGGGRALDITKIRSCRHLLAFHRPDENRRWVDIVTPLLDTLNEFLMITMPGEPVRDMQGVARSAEDELALQITINKQQLNVKEFQKELTARLSAEFVSLTLAAPVSIAERLRRWREYLLPGHLR